MHISSTGIEIRVIFSAYDSVRNFAGVAIQPRFHGISNACARVATRALRQWVR